MESGYFNTVVEGCFSCPRVESDPNNVIFSEFYYGTPPKNVCFTPRDAIFNGGNTIGLVLSSNWAGFDVKTWQPCIKPCIHCAISVRFPCDFSKVSTHTVREDRMRCKAKAHDLCALTIRSDCRARFMCSHYTCEILGLRLRRRWHCIWTIARDNLKQKKNYRWYREDLSFPINVLN